MEIEKSKALLDKPEDARTYLRTQLNVRRPPITLLIKPGIFAS